jgi:hypothetical protein
MASEPEPQLVGMMTDSGGQTIAVVLRAGVTEVIVNPLGRVIRLATAAKHAEFRELLDRAAMPGQVPAVEPAPVYPCCGHCFAGPASDPCGIPHDNPCEECQEAAVTP